MRFRAFYVSIFNVLVTQNFLMKPDMRQDLFLHRALFILVANYCLPSPPSPNASPSFRLECLLKFLLGWMLWNSMRINLFKVKRLSSLCVRHKCLHTHRNVFQLSSKLIDNLWKLALWVSFNSLMIYGRIKSPDTSHVYELMPRKASQDSRANVRRTQIWESRTTSKNFINDVVKITISMIIT